MSDLKRLSWLQAYAAQATGMAGNIYTQARAMVPGFAEGFVNQVEDTTVSLAAPYLTLATDSAAKVLSSVDAQVGVLVSFQSAMDNITQPLSVLAALQLRQTCMPTVLQQCAQHGRTNPTPSGCLAALCLQVDKSLALVEGVHSKNLATFNGAKEQCYSYVEGTVQQAKSLLDPTPYLSKLAALADPDKIVDTSFQYLDPVAGKVAPYGELGSSSMRWHCLAHNACTPAPIRHTAVLNLSLSAVPEPVVKTGLKTYTTVHDTVVVSVGRQYSCRPAPSSQLLRSCPARSRRCLHRQACCGPQHSPPCMLANCTCANLASRRLLLCHCSCSCVPAEPAAVQDPVGPRLVHQQQRAGQLGVQEGDGGRLPLPGPSGRPGRQQHQQQQVPQAADLTPAARQGNVKHPPIHTQPCAHMVATALGQCVRA